MCFCAPRLIFGEHEVIKKTDTTAVRVVGSTVIKDNTTLKAQYDLQISKNN